MKIKYKSGRPIGRCTASVYLLTDGADWKLVGLGQRVYEQTAATEQVTMATASHVVRYLQTTERNLC